MYGKNLYYALLNLLPKITLYDSIILSKFVIYYFLRAYTVLVVKCTFEKKTTSTISCRESKISTAKFNAPLKPNHELSTLP